MIAKDIQQFENSLSDIEEEISRLVEKLSVVDISSDHYEEDIPRQPYGIEKYDTDQIKRDIDRRLLKRLRQKNIGRVPWNRDGWNYGIIGQSIEPIPETCPEILAVDISHIINEAINYNGKNTKPNNTYEKGEYIDIIRIIKSIFELRRDICDCSSFIDCYDQISSGIELLVDWLERKVGYNKLVDSYPVTEYAGQIWERIETLRYCDTIPDVDLSRIILGLDHLCFRVCRYFGLRHEEIKECWNSEIEIAAYIDDYYEFTDCCI